MLAHIQGMNTSTAPLENLRGDYAGMATKIVEAEIYPALARQREALKANAAKAAALHLLRTLSGAPAVL